MLVTEVSWKSLHYGWVPSPTVVSVCGSPGGREALELCLRDWNSGIQFLAVPSGTLA